MAMSAKTTNVNKNQGAVDTVRKKRAKNPNLIVALILAAVVIIGGIVWYAWSSSQTGSGTDATLIARVHDGDGNVTEIPLDQDGETTVTSSMGTNVFDVENGSIHVESATCANKDCIRQGAISQPGQQIICLPNKLWVEIVHEGDADGTMDATKTPDYRSSTDADGSTTSSFDTKSR